LLSVLCGFHYNCLAKSTNRIYSNIDWLGIHHKPYPLMTNTENLSNSIIALNTLKGIHVANTFDIVYCVSEGGFTVHFMRDGKQHITKVNIKQCHSHLEEFGFIKINQTTLVSRYWVQTILKAENKLELKTGEVLYITKHFMKNVLRHWKIL
jgi:two-component system LytT family response regulator